MDVLLFHGEGNSATFLQDLQQAEVSDAARNIQSEREGLAGFTGFGVCSTGVNCIHQRRGCAGLDAGDTRSL